MIADYSAYLTPERLAVEEEAWRESAIFERYAFELKSVLWISGCVSVVEVGCGVGLVPTCFSDTATMNYIGVDANEHCIARARAREYHQPCAFHLADLRLLDIEPCQVVCAFAFLKHFALCEWQDIVVKLLSFGKRYGVFTMNVGAEDHDDFSQGYPHTWVSLETLVDAVRAAGHRVVTTERLHTNETMVRTKPR